MTSVIETKLCSKCGEEKSVEEFYKNSPGSLNFRTQIYRSQCKVCTLAGQKNPITKEKRKGYYKTHYSSRKAWLTELKSNPCTDCGGVFDPVCMQFDHLPEFDKEFEVSKIIYQSKEKALRELEKCELVCANCHALRTKERRENE